MDYGKFFESVVRYATIPVLILLLILAWQIVSRLLSPERQRNRRNKEIRKATAQHEQYLAKRQAEQEETAEQELRLPRS